MAKNKVFKKAQTILEKAQLGELGSSGPRLFSNIQYYKRGEIIKPYLHYLDERALQKSVQNYIETPASHEKINELAKKMNKKLVSPDTLVQEMKDIYEKFPKEVINDIYNLNYEDISKLKFEDRGTDNKFRYHMIEKSNNPVAKVITNQSSLKSMIYTRNMIQYYLMNMAMLQQEDKQAFDDLMNNLQGKGAGGNKSGSGSGGGQQPQQPQQPSQQSQQQPQPDNQPDDQPDDQSNDSGSGNGDGEDQPENNDTPQGNGGHNDAPASENTNPTPAGGGKKASKGDSFQSEENHLKTLMQRFDKVKGSKAILDEVLDNARQTVEMLNDVMTDQQMEEMWKDISGNDYKEREEAIKKTSKQYLEGVERELRGVSMNMGNLKNKIRHILDQSVSFFSANDKPYFESIFDAGTLDGLEDITLLHPQLRKIYMEDINVKQIRKMGKIDLFIDASGSMNSSCGTQGEDGKYISCLLFAKAFAFKMKELNMLNEVYSFQGNVKYEGKHMIDILGITGGGGTCTERVVERIEKNQRNAIVITDAEDSVNTYSPRAFFIGVQGADFSGFKEDYQKNDQLLIFDGKQTFKVGKNGRAVR